MQPQEKQHVQEKEMQQLKLQQEKNLQQDENVVELQNEDQHEEEQLVNEEQQKDLQEEEDNLFFSLFLSKTIIEYLFYLEISERSMSYVRDASLVFSVIIILSRLK